MSYSVPIIPQNLSKQESIVQIAEILNHLTNITDDIFNRINTRIDTNSRTLHDLTSRVNTINSKINKLKGAKKATQIFSSSKYPAAHVNREYVSVFKDVQPIEIERHKIKYKQDDIPSVGEPLEKLQVYHVKLSSNRSKKKLDGLGKMPTDVECVNDLLLYNSGKNLYKHFVMSDALKGPQHIKEDETIVTSAIGSAPRSISERSTLTRSTTHSYFYTPKIGEVPELDVPLDLPDLPGIADDLRYENTIDAAIAPSVLSQTLIELPAIDTIETQEKNEEKIENLPLPPPPVQNEISPTTVSEAVKVEVVEEVKLPMPPPPPPPPPPPALDTVIELPKAPATQPPAASDMRANLMDAIRKAGGSKNARLRSTSAKEAKAKTQAPGGDLMADLHSKLLLRRKGISGTKKQEQENGIDATSTLVKLSAKIPPPAPKNDIQESTATEDEDWEE